MMIKLENIRKSYGDKCVLCELDFSCGNETVAVMGESGSGKTTLLRIIAGLENPDSGTVTADGKIAFSFSEPRLFDNITTLENVTCVMTGEKSENVRKASEILGALGLGEETDKKPSELSSGMAGRVSLARAIASDREIYLLDEPLKGLDDETKRKVSEYLKAYLNGRCAVIVTHDESEASFLASKTFILKDGKLLGK